MIETKLGTATDSRKIWAKKDACFLQWSVFPMAILSLSGAVFLKQL